MPDSVLGDDHRFTYFIGEPAERITPQNLQWRAALPLSRQAQPGPSKPGTTTCGDYFTAAADFLSRNDLALPRKALAEPLGRRPGCEEIHQIRVHLVKHGAFYHPARVTVAANESAVALTLNVAVSGRGCECLPREIANLAHLYDHYPRHFVPCCYGAGEGRTPSGGCLPMFATQWLSRFYEVHPSRGQGSRPLHWSVWDPDHGLWWLSPSQADAFFSQAAFILSYYFDPLTLSTVQAWHHAAGDFVVRNTGKSIDVRLITVRQYRPFIALADDDPIDLAVLLDTLTLFLLRTSLWMRIDRLDGVGDLVWAHDRYLVPIWQGFIRGVSAMAGRNGLPAEFVQGVVQYLAAHPPGALHDLGIQILSQQPGGRPETELIRENLRKHCKLLAAAVAHGLPPM
ncbi:MAG: hypothetical protein HKP58_05000 [Desulfatitalea sp.]|nr:hypothetical protein [Desulfatitalea sp.]NNJ99751.1 hypothetical protein [Desulfatitalea sp.]